ncbi:hypothetical protein [Streptomyces sp. SID8352]|uniref:DUF7224 domain-containing protein n=1 Tax=Streptomyces sp. SID8352 TaxID=2690338 RepID=UPI00136A61D7|nr:hypothetical protein [Streptomyces sp. SID8352]MYU23070.1 hypothetical protein [Streptomyces sp. SID8352]
MIIQHQLRRSAAPWVILPAALFVYLYMQSAVFTVPSRYGVESGESTIYALAAIAPAVAACAAWDSGRIRPVRHMLTTSARSRWSLILFIGTPIAALGAALLVLAVVLAWINTGVLPSGAGWTALVHMFVVPAEWAVIGWYVGGRLPRSFAAPAAAALCWAWLTMPHAMSNAWLRHLGGFIDGTSTITEVHRPEIYFVPWAVTGCFVAAAWLLTRTGSRRVFLPAGAGAAAAALLVGHTAVSGWGYGNPASIRAVDSLCSGTDPQICVPPEYRSYIPQIRRSTQGPLGALVAAGVTRPKRMEILSPSVKPAPGVWRLHWSLPAVHQQAAYHTAADVMAISAVEGTAAQHGKQSCAGPSAPELVWATAVAGDREAVRRGTAPQLWSLVGPVLDEPVKQQSAWFTQQVLNHACPVQGAR